MIFKLFRSDEASLDSFYTDPSRLLPFLKRVADISKKQISHHKHLMCGLFTQMEVLKHLEMIGFCFNLHFKQLL